jgi:hypothetical protein
MSPLDPVGVVRAGRATATEALGYVRSLPELGTTLLLGGLLWAYGVWFVVPSVLVTGYFVRLLRDVPPAPGEVDVTPRPSLPPRFDRWGALFLDGVRAYVVWTIYLFLAFTAALPHGREGEAAQAFLMFLRPLLGNAWFLLNVQAAFGAERLAQASLGASGLDLPGAILFLAAMYVAPAALVNVAARGSLSDGFAFDDIRPIIASPSYAGRWLGFVVLWVASTAILYLPAAWVATAVAPSELPVVVEALRESIELLRGIASFALLAAGYAIIGRVGVPPTDGPAVPPVLRAIYGSRLAPLVRDEIRFLRTLLVASLLATFWSLPAVVLLAGYLVRFVRSVGAGDPPPRFDRPASLVADGCRAVALWVAYATLPIVLLIDWWSGTAPDARLLTALSGVPGLGLGSWYLGRDYFNALSGWSPPGLDPDLALVAFAIASVLALYLYPAGIVGLARERRLRAGLDPRSVARWAARPAYAAVWLRSAALLTIGGALSVSWNWWRLGRPGADTETLVSVGQVALIVVPTGTGIASSLYLFAVSAAGVLLLVRAYGGIAHLDRESADRRTDGR